MKTSIKLVLALAGIAAMALSSCNTVAGFGRDIQGAGEAINKSANR
jgi:predicted small secreted protein